MKMINFHCLYIHALKKRIIEPISQSAEISIVLNIINSLMALVIFFYQINCVVTMQSLVIKVILPWTK